MRFTVLIYFVLLILSGSQSLFAEDTLQKARFTEVIRDVRVTKANANEMREAKVNDNFEVPEVIRTGMDSRAELEAPDKTIARIGSNTIFSFEGAKRTMNLQSGSVLFHAPKGMGGGIIKTAAATAAVTGTTIMVGATSNGGFKLMVLEGSSKVTLPNGVSQRLNEGQLTFILPGTQNKLPVIDFRLTTQTKGSGLVGGFNKPLASLEKITQAEIKQERNIAKGRLQNTTLRVVGEDKEGVKVLDDGRSFPTLSEVNPSSRPTLNDYLAKRIQQVPSAVLSGNGQIDFKDLYFSKSTERLSFRGKQIDIQNAFGAFGADQITFSNGANFTLPSSIPNGNIVLGDFGFFGDGDIKFLGDANFNGSSAAHLHFISFAGNMNFAPGTINFAQNRVSFEAPKVMNIDGTTFTGKHLIFSANSVNINQGTIFNVDSLTIWVRNGYQFSSTYTANLDNGYANFTFGNTGSNNLGTVGSVYVNSFGETGTGNLPGSNNIRVFKR